MKVAVYTGTFNPLHKGHLAIMKYLTESGGFDTVYLTVSPQSPFKPYMAAESGAARLKAAEEAVARHPGLRVRVEDIELHLPAPQYTVRTLDALKKREPGNEFTLVIGADNLLNIDRWKDADRILTEYGVAVYPRKGYDMAAIRNRLMSVNNLLQAGEAGRTKSGNAGGSYRILLMSDAPVVDISSTEIREGIAAGRDMSEYLM